MVKRLRMVLSVCLVWLLAAAVPVLAMQMPEPFAAARNRRCACHAAAACAAVSHGDARTAD